MWIKEWLIGLFVIPENVARVCVCISVCIVVLVEPSPASKHFSVSHLDPEKSKTPVPGFRAVTCPTVD